MEGSPVLEVVESPLDAEDAILANAPLPDALPVLPLRETVTFPDTMTPLAVGQERSIKLVNDVLGANRMLVMVASRDPENEEPGPSDLYEVGVVGVVARMMKVPDGTLRILVQGTQRVRLGPYVAEEPYLVARIAELPDQEAEESPELEALTRNVQRTFSEIIEQIPYLPEELQLAVANIDDPSALCYLIAGALRISTEEKQELLEEDDVAARLRGLSQNPQPRARGGAARHPDPVAGAVRSRQRPARVPPAPAAESDPGRARRGGRGAGGNQRAARADRGGRAARARAQGGRPRALAAGETAVRRRRARRHPHLPRVAGRAALVEADRGQPRHRPRARGPRRRPLRPRENQGPDPRVPGGAQAQPRLARARSSASSARPGSARRASAARSPRRWAASSSGSRSAASATRPRSAATAAPTSAPCRGRSSAPCATPAPATRSS